MSRLFLSTHQSMSRPPQTEPLPGQSPNNAGGFSWKTDSWIQLERFLILGSEGGTYYVGEKDLTKANITECLNALMVEPGRFIEVVVDISKSGRAVSNEPAVFLMALALIQGSPLAKTLVQLNINEVCRTGTDILHFVKYATNGRGWGRALRTTVGNWFLHQDSNELAYEVTKYQSRDGWSMRDLLRSAHPMSKTVAHNEVFKWITKGWDDVGPLEPGSPGLNMIWAMEQLKRTNSLDVVVQLILNYRLVREVVPTTWLQHAAVWEALLVGMPLGATLRNLANFTRLGIFDRDQDALERVVARLTNDVTIRRSRLHPIDFLVAAHTYDTGRSLKGTNTWLPNATIMAALQDGLDVSFEVQQPTHKSIIVGVDLSASMKRAMTSGLEMLSTCEAAAVQALALVKAEVGGRTNVLGFDTTARPFQIARNWNWKLVAKMVKENANGAGTNCAAPIEYATQTGLKADAFVILTDNETWAGEIHPETALRDYRQKMGDPRTKLVVVCMAANRETIGDPNDERVLNIVGFDSHAPSLIQDFIRD